jgi:predicted lipoprotein with Yx(FWY)xxD motif
MKFRLFVLAALVAATSVIAGASASASSKKPSGALIQLRSTHKGKILVDSHGYTLYGFGPDKKNKDVCAAIPQCLSLWPAVTTNGKPQAGKGVNAHLLGTIKLGRKLQVTYNGHPLYTYVQDTRPGETDNINIDQFGGPWPAVNAAGKFVK